MNPLNFPDFDGRPRVEPSIASRYRVVEAARFVGENPFVATLLAAFDAGAPDEVFEYPGLAPFLDAHDPERAGAAGAVLGTFAFRPSPEQGVRGAPRLRCVRIGAGEHVPTRSTLALADAEDDAVITLRSLDYGLHTNRLRAKVEAGTLSGRKILLGYKDTPAFVRVGDNLGLLFTLSYTLACTTATVTVTAVVAGTATRLQTAVVDPAAGTGNLDIDLTSLEFDTVQKVVNFINRQPGYVATPAVTDLDLTACPTSQLDAQNAVNIKALSPAITASIGAIVEWVNANAGRLGPIPGVSAARVANAVNAPAAMAAWSNLAGGTKPAVDSTDYDAALGVLDREEVPSGVLFVDTSDATIRDLVLAWMDEQEAKGRLWRAVFGLPAGTSDAAARIAAGKIDRERVALWQQRTVDILQSTVTHNPIVAAAAFAGLTAGINAANDVQTLVLTNRRLRAGAVLKVDRRALEAREANLSAGVNMLREERPGGRVVVSLAVSTHQGNKRTHRMWAESVAIDLIRHSVEQAVKPLNVAWGTRQYVAAVKSAVQAVLAGWANENNPLISAGTDPETGELRPAFTPPQVTVSNGQTTVSFAVGLVGETDHVRIDAVVHKVNLQSEAA